MRAADRLLDKVADATRERDADTLRDSLVRTLDEVIAPRWTSVVDLGVAPGLEDEAPATDEWRNLTPPAEFRLSPSEVRRTLDRGPGPWLTEFDDGSQLFLRRLGDEWALISRLERPTHEDVRLVGSFCRLYENFLGVLREAERDRLTGLLNRRSFDYWLDRITTAGLSGVPAPQPRDASVTRGPLCWWLALFDVDHFKRINDHYGHLYGDEVLLLLSRITRACFRGEDRCFRYGGEEFAVLLARNDEAGTMIALERLRQRIEAHVFPQVGKVTVSIGAASLIPGTAASVAIDRADRALYDAKRGGRNRTVLAPRAEGPVSLEVTTAVGTVELF
ncbi:MAG TPA: GGDEF domain-containing protein [Nevskiaceae bacterium]|nr:GGDEF domain-containing protein [Nevskiaceae bacterium]